MDQVKETTTSPLARYKKYWPYGTVRRIAKRLQLTENHITQVLNGNSSSIRVEAAIKKEGVKFYILYLKGELDLAILNDDFDTEAYCKRKLEKLLEDQ